VSKLTTQERELAKTIVGMMSIKRIPDSDIIAEKKRQTNKKLSRITLYHLRQRIKKDSYHWYKTMREGEYEYIHEFKERINEILFLQKKHHQIKMRNGDNPQIQQASLAELHRLFITLSNLYDVAPTIIGVGKDATITITPEIKTSTAPTEFMV
jgi:hypothetical protein